jgi:formate-dependent nitrite reductase cytochrome c552 subunit
VLALADKSQAELRRSIADLTKKCDDLLRHKRFLANQAAESSAFSAAAKRNKSRKSQQGDGGDAELHGAVHSGEIEVHSEDEEAGGEDDLECAVCRSAMSEELQVRVVITYVTWFKR